MWRLIFKRPGPYWTKCFVIVSVLVCVLYQIKDTNARHLKLHSTHEDKEVVKAIEGDEIQSKRQASSLQQSELKKTLERQSQNQYNKNWNQDEFLSGVPSRKKYKLHTSPKQSGSSFRHHQHFFGDDLPSYVDDEQDEENDPMHMAGDFQDPHFYQERFISSSSNQDANHKGIKEDHHKGDDDEDSDELGRYSLVNSYFDNQYSLSMLQSMNCITPTKSKGYCSTFRACVPSLFNSEGELEAPALAELVSMSIGYCTTETTDISGRGGSNVLMKRISSHKFTTVSNRIICCPGVPPKSGIPTDEVSAEKLNEFLAVKGPQVSVFDEDDNRTPIGIPSRKKKPYVSPNSVVWSANEDEFNAHENVNGESAKPFPVANDESSEAAKPETSSVSQTEKVNDQGESVVGQDETSPKINGDKIDNVQQFIPIEAFDPTENDHHHESNKFSDQLLSILDENSSPPKNQEPASSIENDAVEIKASSFGSSAEVSDSSSSKIQSVPSLENDKTQNLEKDSELSQQNESQVPNDEQSNSSYINKPAGTSSLDISSQNTFSSGNNGVLIQDDESKIADNIALESQENSSNGAKVSVIENTHINSEIPTESQGSVDQSKYSNGNVEDISFTKDQEIPTGITISNSGQESQESIKFSNSNMPANMGISNFGSSSQEGFINNHGMPTGSHVPEDKFSNGNKPPYIGNINFDSSDEILSNNNQRVPIKPTGSLESEIQSSEVIHNNDVSSSSSNNGDKIVSQGPVSSEKLQITHGENSTIIKISPEPVIGVNGKFTLEKGVHVEKATSETPRPKPNPAYQTQIGETTVNVIKAETTVDSNSLLLINTPGNGKPVAVEKNKESPIESENGEILQVPTFSAKIPQVENFQLSHQNSQHLDNDVEVNDEETSYETTTVRYQSDDNNPNDPNTFGYDHNFNKNSESTTVQEQTTTERYVNTNTEESESILNDDDSQNLPTTTVRYFNDNAIGNSNEVGLITDQLPTTTRRYSYESLVNDEHDDNSVEAQHPTTTFSNYFNHNNKEVDSQEETTTQRINLINEQTTTRPLLDNNNEEQYLSDHHKDHQESEGTTVSNGVAQDDESFFYETTVHDNLQTHEPKATTPFVTPNTNDDVETDPTLSPLSTISSLNVNSHVEVNNDIISKPQSSVSNEAFPGTSGENQNQIFLAPKDPSSYEMQSFDDSAETDFSVLGGRPPTKPLFLENAAKPSHVVPPQVHEDDSLENEHDSPYPSSPNDWSIDKLYQQQINNNKLKPLSNSNEKIMLETGSSNEGQKDASTKHNQQDEPSLVESLNQQPAFEIPISSAASELLESSQNNPKPDHSGENFSSENQKPQISSVASSVFNTPGSSSKPFDTSDNSGEASKPFIQQGSEIGGINPQGTNGRPEYQILSACATQDYYRSLEEDSSKQYPYLATIVGGSRPFCSGSLITDRHILTAAHFLANITVADVFHMRVHIGYRAGFGGQTEGPYAVRKVVKVIRHKGFSFEKLLNDIAILVLDRPIQFSEEVHPVCLSHTPQLYTTGFTDAYETGWIEDPLMKKISPHHPFIDPHILKYFTFGHENITWTLQESITKVKTNDECQANYAFLEKNGITITDSMICASTNDGKSCSFKGNSGAPLFLRSGNKPIQLGIVSWGLGCGHFPAVFTGVSNYLPWIEKVVERTS